MRPIDADSLIEVMLESKKVAQRGLNKDAKYAYATHDYFIRKIKKHPTADVVEKLDKIKTLLLKYSEIGTIEDVRDAMEKKKAKKPIKMNVKQQYRCPCCNNRVTKLCKTEAEIINSRESFCQNCGQAIDWRDEYE